MRALLVHPGFNVIGGAEKVSLHITRYLINQGWEVSLLSLAPPNLEQISDNTEFSFDPGDLNLITAFCPEQILGKPAFSLIQIAFLHRSAKRHAKHHDLCISTYNEINFGKPGIQYIHHPYWPRRELLHRYHTISNTNILDQSSLLEGLYRFLAHTIAGNFSGFSQNITAVNSEFIKHIVTSIYGIDSNVLYPGFLQNEDFISTNEGRKNNQLVAISRITPDKRIIELIKAFAELSRVESSAKLIIAGYAPNRDYLNYVKEYIQKHSLCLNIELSVDAAKDEIRNLLTESQFFISTKKYEHFGISVLEAAASGCIPIVHNSGGVIEIVPYPELQYNSFDQIPGKIISLNKNSAQLHDLRAKLQEHIRLFRLENFNKGLNKVIKELKNIS